MISANQLRAARKYLDWTRAELSALTDLSPETIKNIEKNTNKPNTETNKKLVNIFLQEGIEFVEGGIRRLPSPMCPKCGYEPPK